MSSGSPIWPHFSDWESSARIYQEQSLPHPMAFHSKMTGFVIEGRAAAAVCMDFTKAFDTGSHRFFGTLGCGWVGKPGWMMRLRGSWFLLGPYPGCL